MEKIKQIPDAVFDEVVAIRRTLHENPELSFSEYKTADLICAHLEKLGIPYERGIAKTGVVGLIEVNKQAKTLLMRADMDALPIQEETTLSFKSKTAGCMHACGHDAHVAILLGVATILTKLKDKLSCNVKLVFQPGEETEGGAEPMIAAGILENPHVDAAIGGHVMTNVPVGKVSVQFGEMMASPDDFTLTVHGKGGHGAYPHLCVDPIAVGVQILSAWNALSARYTTPTEKHVISTNEFHAGTCPNVIPDTAHISGTVRTFNEKLRQELAKRMKSIAEETGKAFGADCDFVYNFRYPPLITDINMTDTMRKSAEAVLGKENVLVGEEPSLCGDDFSYFCRYVPATFFNIGAANEALGPVQPLHSSTFMIDETALKTGMMVMSQFALDFGR